MTSRLAVLLSGRGSNFAAIADAIERRELDAEIVAVIANRADAAGLEHARQRGLTAHVVEHRAFSSRESHEAALIELLRPPRVDFVCLAGYMRRLTPTFIGAFPQRILNIHPSLLPSFPGVDAQAQAIAYGVKVTGCTVHFVDEGVDTGPIILQRTIEVRDDDDASSLSQRLIAEEHRAYVDALKIVCSGAYAVEGRRVKRQ